MPAKLETGVLFPSDGSGKRSTLQTGKAVFAAAVRPVNKELADSILAEPNFRKTYERYVVKVAEAGATSPEAAIMIAEAGLAEVYKTFEFVRPGAAPTDLATAMASPSASAAFSSGTVKGALPPSQAFEVPLGGETLSGEALAKQLKAWSDYGCMEPGVEAALGPLARGKVDLSGRVFVVLGATSALGPLTSLLKWGATVIGVARPKAKGWAELIAAARATSGTFVFPVRGGGAVAGADDAALAASAGADLMTDTPEILAWLKVALAELRCADPVVGMYTYLDSDAHVRVSLACDAIMKELAVHGSAASLAYIATPSLAYDIPHEAREASAVAWGRAWLSYLGYTPNARPAVPFTTPPRYIHDGMMNLQGPNYALAKTLQMWRALLARSRDGVVVSANCAPAARTASMVAGDNKNAGAVAAGLDGMAYFAPMMAFDQETVSACMAGLLAHDVTSPSSPAHPHTSLAHPFELFSKQAFHGGSFRTAVRPGQLGTLMYLGGKILGPKSAL